MCVCVCVCQYLEKFSDGRTVMRSEAEEGRAACQHELKHQRYVEALLAKLQQEIENERSGIAFLFEKALWQSEYIARREVDTSLVID